MDTQVANIHEAKTNLSLLLKYAEEGEVVLIARAGKPIARLVVITPRKQGRKPGIWKGKVKMASDFDELPEDLISAFEGKAA